MKFRVLLSVSLVVITLMSVVVMAVEPFGAGVTEVSNSTAPADSPSTQDAIAGNITELTVTGFSTTQSWQGYFGNVSGTVQLADASDNILYNWSLASPEGEIYASTSSSIDWNSIDCFDLVTNHVALEAAFGIASDDVDGVNETFSDSGTHDLFYTNNVLFTAGQCASTSIYDSTGASVDNNFEEVLLTDGSATTQVIFTSILDEEDLAGFDNAYHDFEMLVLEDGHGINTTTTTYYFWVELE